MIHLVHAAIEEIFAEALLIRHVHGEVSDSEAAIIEAVGPSFHETLAKHLSSQAGDVIAVKSSKKFIPFQNVLFFIDEQKTLGISRFLEATLTEAHNKGLKIVSIEAPEKEEDEFLFIETLLMHPFAGEVRISVKDNEQAIRLAVLL